MIRKRDEGRHSLDVRTKLLVMLAVLSLPLLIVSLVQLQGYRRSITEQATTIARVKSVAAEGALGAWLETHPHVVRQRDALTPALASDLYARLRQHASPDSDAAIVVLDAKGHAVVNPAEPVTTSAPQSLARDVAEQHWPDGARRLTAVRRNAPTGWGVAVGAPLPENTPAGRSILLVAATWALALLSSIFLSVWAVGRFTKPLRELASSASTFGEGRLHERVAVETDDEVGTLAAGFNAMAARLEGKFNELRTQGAFIAEVLDSLPLGVVMLDANLVVRRANSAFAEFVGRDPESLAGRGLYEAAAGVAALSEVVEDVRRTRRAFVSYGLALELVAREGDGPKFWDVILWPTTEANAGSGDLILILSEVSKRVRAEKLATAAFASEKARAVELESIINQMDEGVLLVDEGGRYRLNPAAARILGRKTGESGDDLRALVSEMALGDAQGRPLSVEETPLGRAFERGERVSGEHVEIVRADGEEIILEVSATPLVDEAGRRAGLVAVFRDITRDARQYRELMEAYSRLREHDRLKSAFVANVSHELRTPLNVIIGLCQLLERDPQLPLAPLQGEAVMRMERNARALLELVNHLLDYSRLEAGRAALLLEEVDVASVVAEAISDFEAEARDKHLRLRADVAPELGPVSTDRHKLTQVVANLLSNAVKFTATGEITVSAAPLDDARWYLEVSDTGIGISPEAVSFIFEEFRQGDDRLARSYSGVGLGLAITRKIVELLEGEITVESRPNRGSRFRITWPRAAHQRTGTGSLIRETAEQPDAAGAKPDGPQQVTNLRTYARR